MKAVILAGGLGTRIAEESDLRPKPMIEIGGKPMLWHIMKMYSHFGINEFVVCLGYKGYVIKEYFLNYFVHNADVTVDLASGESTIGSSASEPWKIHLVDTGLHTMTGGRLKRVASYIQDETFCLTYGDGVSNVDMHALLAQHKQSNRAATVTAVQPPGRFGVLEVETDGAVSAFTEKPGDEMGWINGGFFVLEPSVLDYVASDDTVWEREPLERLAADGQLNAYRHSGFWRPMDTLRDKRDLEQLWESNKAPWRHW